MRNFITICMVALLLSVSQPPAEAAGLGKKLLRGLWKIHVYTTVAVCYVPFVVGGKLLNKVCEIEYKIYHKLYDEE